MMARRMGRIVSVAGWKEVWRPFVRFGRVGVVRGIFVVVVSSKKRNGTDSHRPSSLAGYFIAFLGRISHVGLWDLRFCIARKVLSGWG